MKVRRWLSTAVIIALCAVVGYFTPIAGYEYHVKPRMEDEHNRQMEDWCALSGRDWSPTIERCVLS